MSLSINTNVGAMVALESLTDTTNQLDTAQNEVSTGLKVSSAADNPATYAISQTMDGNISGLSAVSDGLSFAAETVSTTSTAVGNILSTLALLQTAVTSLGSNQGDPTALTQTSQEINGYLNEINSFARNATVNGVNLLTSSTDANSGNGISGTSFADAVTATTLNYVTGLQGQTNMIGNAVTGTNGTTESTNISSAVTTFTTNSITGSATLGTLSTESLTDLLGLSTGATSGASFVDGASAGAMNAFVVAAGTGTSASLADTTTDLVALVQNAIVAMGNVSAQLGANSTIISGLTSYSSNLSDSLTAGVGALTDADMAAESAKLTSLQTKQQLAIQSLSIAKSSSSNILTLFR